MFVNQNMKTGPSLFGSEPAKPNHSLLEDCLDTTDRKKADTNDQQARKRLKGAGDPSEATVKTVTANGRKNKADTNKQPTQKRLNGAGDSSEVTVKAVATNGRKRKAVTKTKKKVRTDVSHTSDVTKESGLHETQSRDEELAAKQRDECDVSPSSSAGSSPFTSRKNFEAKYLQLKKLGQGGFGSVYAGSRKTDKLPVAIKHIPRDWVEYQQKVIKNVVHEIPLEVLLMQAAAVENSEGKCAAVSLLDWYNLEDEVVLVMERPVPCVDLLEYLKGPMKEDKAKDIMRQLVEAAIQIQSQGVFHQDLKQENVLIETSSDIPRVRIIDFGGGCFDKEEPSRSFHGTEAYCPPEYYSVGTYWACNATVWQLGALLHEILLNKTFNTHRFMESCRKPKNEVEKMKVTKCCKHLLMRCLAIDPRCRASLKEIQSHPWLN